MNKYLLQMLEGGAAADWVVASFPVIRIVLVCIIALCAGIMIVTTLLQSNENESGTTALTGGVQESYYAQNKGESKNVKLSRATVICVATIMVCIVLYCITFLFFKGSI